MEMTVGFYCSPKREVLLPKSLFVEVVLKLWGQLPEFCCGFMSYKGLNVFLGEYENTVQLCVLPFDLNCKMV